MKPKIYSLRGQDQDQNDAGADGDESAKIDPIELDGETTIGGMELNTQEGIVSDAGEVEELKETLPPAPLPTPARSNAPVPNPAKKRKMSRDKKEKQTAAKSRVAPPKHPKPSPKNKKDEDSTNDSKSKNDSKGKLKDDTEKKLHSVSRHMLDFTCGTVID